MVAAEVIVGQVVGPVLVELVTVNATEPVAPWPSEPYEIVALRVEPLRFQEVLFDGPLVLQVLLLSAHKDSSSPTSASWRALSSCSVRVLNLYEREQSTM